ncbi:MAG: rhodanese-like domain-containing protein [Bacteroidetes bacterium]|nr:rhodanese-like domain-containing protein [Bacteroidota bacterium]
MDVRTPEEWNSEGHASCSVNYPLDILTSKFEKLKMYDTIYVVCRSGNRASIAKEMLELEGIAIVENKGAWQNIHCQ